MTIYYSNEEWSVWAIYDNPAFQPRKLSSYCLRSDAELDRLKFERALGRRHGIKQIIVAADIAPVAGASDRGAI